MTIYKTILYPYHFIVLQNEKTKEILVQTQQVYWHSISDYKAFGTIIRPKIRANETWEQTNIKGIGRIIIYISR